MTSRLVRDFGLNGMLPPRISVCFAEAGSNTKLAVDPPIHIFTNRVFSQPSNSILLLGSREIANPSDLIISIYLLPVVLNGCCGSCFHKSYLITAKSMLILAFALINIELAENPTVNRDSRRNF